MEVDGSSVPRPRKRPSSATHEPRARAAPKEQQPDPPIMSRRTPSPVESSRESVEEPKPQSKKSGKSRAKPEPIGQRPMSRDRAKDVIMEVDDEAPHPKPRHNEHKPSHKAKGIHKTNGLSADARQHSPQCDTQQSSNASTSKSQVLPPPAAPSTPPRQIHRPARDQPGSSTAVNGHSESFDVDMVIAPRERELTEEERAMTVEQWLRHEIGTQYEELRQDSTLR